MQRWYILKILVWWGAGPWSCLETRYKLGRRCQRWSRRNPEEDGCLWIKYISKEKTKGFMGKFAQFDAASESKDTNLSGMYPMVQQGRLDWVYASHQLGSFAHICFDAVVCGEWWWLCSTLCGRHAKTLRSLFLWSRLLFLWVLRCGARYWIWTL